MAFVHSHRKGYPRAWHTDAASNDIVTALSVLNTSYVQHEGYANLRCNPAPGCDNVHDLEPWKRLHNVTRPLTLDHAAELAWVEAWPALFGDRRVPERIGAACCAQFAVSRTQVLKRSRRQYERYHRWLMETDMPDDISGRVFEYAWHMIFGKEAVQ